MNNAEVNKPIGAKSPGTKVTVQIMMVFFGVLLIFNILAFVVLGAEEAWIAQDPFLVKFLLLDALIISSWIIFSLIIRDQNSSGLPLFKVNLHSPLEADRIELIRNRYFASPVKGFISLGISLGFSLFPIFMAVTYGVERPFLIPITVLLCWGALIVSNKMGEDKSGGCVSNVIVIIIMGIGFSLSGIGEPEETFIWFIWLFICLASGAILTAALFLFMSSFKVLRHGWSYPLTSIRGTYTKFQAVIEFCAWLLIIPLFASIYALISLLVPMVQEENKIEKQVET